MINMKQYSKYLFIPALIFLSSSVLAKNGDEPASKVDIINNVEEIAVAKITLENGNTIGWYEVGPGILVRGHKFKYPNVPEDDIDREFADSMTPMELYSYLAPDEKAPLALRKAHARAVDFSRKAPRKPPSTIISPDLIQDGSSRDRANVFDAPAQIQPGFGVLAVSAIDDSAYPWSWFRTTFECRGGSAYDWLVRWSFRSGTANIYKNDQNRVYAAAGSYRGAIRFRTRYRTWFSWSSWSADVVLQTGEGWKWTRFSTTDYDFNARVDQASGDGFHMCGKGWG